MSISLHSFTDSCTYCSCHTSFPGHQSVYWFAAVVTAIPHLYLLCDSLFMYLLIFGYPKVSLMMWFPHSLTLYAVDLLLALSSFRNSFPPQRNAGDLDLRPPSRHAKWPLTRRGETAYTGCHSVSSLSLDVCRMFQVKHCRTNVDQDLE